MILNIAYEEIPSHGHQAGLESLPAIGCTEDNEYNLFLQSRPLGSFFFFRALHLYGWSDLVDVNDLLQTSYDLNPNDYLSFGQDLFGQQFCFTRSRQIVRLDLESLNEEYIASCFSEFDEAIFNRANFITCWPLAEAWVAKNNVLIDYNERLCPNLPFVLGGEFTVENLHKIDFKLNIQYCASLWKQIKDFPDGTTVRWKIIPPDQP